MAPETREIGDGHALVGHDGHRSDVLLNRPEKRNAMHEPVIADLTEAIATAADRDETRAIALLGEGPVFSAGMDLGMMHDLDVDEHGGMQDDLNALFDLIEAVDPPVVAGVHGAAIAGAFELTLPCDFRVMGEDATYGLFEVKLGVFPTGGATQRLPRLVGLSKAKELVLKSDFIDAAEAKTCGLVHEVVPAGEDVAAATREYADALAEHAPLGMARGKRALNESLDHTLEEGLERESELGLPLYDTADRKEGFAARLEDREPEFVGE